MSVGVHAARLICLEWLELSDRQQDRNIRRLGAFLNALAHFDATVPWHVDVQDHQVWFQFGQLFERCGTVVNRHYFITGFTENPPAHVLGGYAVIRKQYFPRQGFIPSKGGTAAKLTWNER
jgi:hypothetical protein